MTGNSRTFVASHPIARDALASDWTILTIDIVWKSFAAWHLHADKLTCF